VQLPTFDCECPVGTFGSVFWTPFGYEASPACAACTPIENGSGAIRCSASGVSFAVDPVAFDCAEGYVLVRDSTVGDKCLCMSCTPGSGVETRLASSNCFALTCASLTTAVADSCVFGSCSG
jgi:hypothetical protein